MPNYNSGAKHNRWKGGRSVASNGYVLIKLPKDHPFFCMTDVRGYVYEHRLVAAQELGRPLRKGEIAHHAKDHAKTNNSPENIEVKQSVAEHRFEHRKHVDSGRRNPGGINPLISCMCGCGTTFNKFDSSGRPRLYVSGHNPHNAPTIMAVERFVLAGLSTHARIASEIGVSCDSVKQALSKLVKNGKIARCGYGVYGKLGSPPIKPQRLIECSCGCGETFNKYDSSGRERHFISGHNKKNTR